ncbi:MAG: DMT family transporter [Pikeienuella sp.]|uniref:DMT family transporter n=1 Tax=Pikeienuella sp. TaxID=2831957 RepID=UPI00391D0DF9
MARKERIDAFGGAFLVGFSALLGLNQVLVKLVNAGFAPAFQAGLRSALAFLPVLIFALLMRKRLSLSDGSFRPGVICGLLFSVEFVLLFMALDFTTVSRASIFFYTMPVWVTLGAHFLIPGEGMTKAKALGLVFAVSGVALALSGNATPATEWALVGDLMCLLAALCWAAIALMARTTAFSKSIPEMQLLYQLAVSAPAMIAFAVLTGDTIREPTEAHLAILLFQSFVVVGMGFLTWFWVLSVYPASDMASFGFLAPVFGVIFGWLVFDDALTLQLVAALALVGLGIVLVNRKSKRGPTRS